MSNLGPKRPILFCLNFKLFILGRKRVAAAAPLCRFQLKCAFGASLHPRGKAFGCFATYKSLKYTQNKKGFFKPIFAAFLLLHFSFLKEKRKNASSLIQSNFNLKQLLGILTRIMLFGEGGSDGWLILDIGNAEPNGDCGEDIDG